MRPIVIGLIAILAAAAISPSVALAQRGGGGGGESGGAGGMGGVSPGGQQSQPTDETGGMTAEERANQASQPSTHKQTVDPAQRQQGMKDAPGVIKAAGIDCQLADARYIGEATDSKTKVTSKYYELACKGAEGFIVSMPEKAGPLPMIYSCLEVAGSHNASLSCILPGNADPKAGLQPLIAKYKPSCQMTDARALGQTQDRKVTVFEVACQGGPGYIIDASFPVSANQPAQFNPCYAFAPEANRCTLTNQAAQEAYIAAMVAKIGKPCTMTNHRYIGSTASGATYFEVACQEGKGYVFEQKPDGSIGQVADCAIADSVISGGCTLTNARQAQTEQAGLYSKLAQKAGFDCTVSKYFPFDSAPPGFAEVVELACSNRPDGGVLLSPSDSSKPSVFYDCAHSEMVGFRCSFTKADAAFPSVTKDLNTLGKSSCVVSGERVMGAAAGVSYLEVACADGAPGYVMSYDTNTMTPKEAVGCALAKDIAGGCQMPENQPKH